MQAFFDGKRFASQALRCFRSDCVTYIEKVQVYISGPVMTAPDIGCGYLNRHVRRLLDAHALVCEMIQPVSELPLQTDDVVFASVRESLAYVARIDIFAVDVIERGHVIQYLVFCFIDAHER